MEDKLRRLSQDNAAYRPQEPAERLASPAVCLREVAEFDLNQVSGGLLDDVTTQAVRVLSRSGDLEDFDLERAAFVDTETTGLAGGAGTVAFLIGIGYARGDRFIVEQFFMQDYDVEQEMLQSIHKLLRGFDTLVSFNGKSFDVPLIASRSVLNRIRTPLDELAQVDLLHAARRIYKLRLRHCDLQSLERHVLGQEREGDIPGAMVPAMFFDYLHTGDFEPMKLVLEHNRQDIVSLMTLLSRLCRAVSHTEGLSHAEDQYSCARLQQSMGMVEQAEERYRLAAGQGNLGQRELSLLLKRQGRHGEAAQMWADMAATGGFGLFPWEELAKHHEHRTGRLDEAMQAVQRALEQAQRMGLGPGTAQWEALVRRRDRLYHKDRSNSSISPGRSSAEGDFAGRQVL